MIFITSSKKPDDEHRLAFLMKHMPNPYQSWNRARVSLEGSIHCCFSPNHSCRCFATISYTKSLPTRGKKRKNEANGHAPFKCLVIRSAASDLI